MWARGEIGWSLDSDTAGVTAGATHPCPFSPDSDFCFGPPRTFLAIQGVDWF